MPNLNYSKNSREPIALSSAAGLAWRHLAYVRQAKPCQAPAAAAALDKAHNAGHVSEITFLFDYPRTPRAPSVFQTLLDSMTDDPRTDAWPGCSQHFYI